MSTLYELTTEFELLMEMAEDPEADFECIKDTLEGLDGEIEIKADGYAKVMRELDGKISSIKSEIDRLSARKKHIEQSIDTMKKTLEMAMRTTEKTKFKTELFSFNIQKNPASVLIAEDIDINEVPNEFLKFEAPKVDKTAVKDALKRGEEISWAQLVQTESLRIK